MLSLGGYLLTTIFAFSNKILFFSGYAMALKMNARLFASVLAVLNLFIIVPRSCGALRPIKIGE